jgi:hypothetical protein
MSNADHLLLTALLIYAGGMAVAAYACLYAFADSVRHAWQQRSNR